MEESANVLLVEGHALMRTALRHLVRSSGRAFIDEASTPLEAIRLARQCHPQVIIVDGIWPEVNLSYLSQILRELAPWSKIVLLVDAPWLADGDAAGRSGADALVVKTSLAQDLPRLLAQWAPGQNGQSEHA